MGEDRGSLKGFGKSKGRPKEMCSGQGMGEGRVNHMDRDKGMVKNHRTTDGRDVQPLGRRFHGSMTRGML